MKSKIMTIVFLTSLLLQNLTEAQFEFKQFLNDNKVSVGIILTLLCGGYYMHSKHKSEKRSLEDKIQTKDDEIKQLIDEKSAMKEKVDVYDALNWKKQKDSQGSYRLYPYFNDVSLALGFKNEQNSQERTLDQVYQDNKKSGKIPEKKNN
jgi:hypothetical protein